MIQPVQKNHSVPELIIDQAQADRILKWLSKGHYVRVSGDGSLVGNTDGTVFVWCRTAQPIGSVIRREFTLTTMATSCAVHFKILRASERKEAMAMVRGTLARKTVTLKRGFWYEVHGD